MRRLRILIIDDVTLNCKVLKKILSQKFECDFVTVNNISEGLLQYASEQFDFTFLDINFPEYDGRDFLKIVTKWENNPAHKNNPVIVFTDLASFRSIRHLCEYQFVIGFIRKPINKKEVIQLLNLHCDGVAL